MQSRTGEPLPGPLAGDLDVDDLEENLHREPEPGASELARRIWEALADGTIDVEQILSAVGATPAALASALLELELAGLIERLPGPSYARALKTLRGSR